MAHEDVAHLGRVVEGVVDPEQQAASLAAAHAQPDFAGVARGCGYIVEDLERSLEEFAARRGVGPWSLRERFRPTQGRYRGEPMEALVSLARSYSGHLMIELIQQHDDSPSVFHEGDGPRRYGFHTEAQERHYKDMYLAAVDWDGRDPIRRDGVVNR